ncbi:MAG TPA: type II toxin-antitoxin system RelE/ParE family toxin [Phycisphaerae bacterium]|nr:type II toxin-antitoxin system RelE/ParE family toxin [Phycisphaerae bacterium]
MLEYELAPGAVHDLRGIARYTIKTWGLEQADRYEAALRNHFQEIGLGTKRSRQFLDHRPDLHVCRCEHHYTFFLKRENARPLILAVLHEKMDLMNRLRDRFEDVGDTGMFDD